MADNLVPSSEPLVPGVRGFDSQLQAWTEPRAGVPALTKSPLERPVAAIRRYKWLMLAVILVSAGAGVAATKFVAPAYEVRAGILIGADSPMESGGGPIRTVGLLEADDWAQLLRTFRISDAVVRKLSLFLKPADADDLGYFKGFALADSYRSGSFELVVDGTRKRWTFASVPATDISESGGAADSVGRKAGFQWVLPAWVWSVAGEHKVRFTVITPREASIELTTRLTPVRARTSSFLNLKLLDTDPKRAETVLNTWVNEFVSVAAALKKRKLVEFARTLEGQLHTAKVALDTAESQLQTFRINTITLPSERGGIAPGLSDTRDPVLSAYFESLIAYEKVKHDVASLETLISRVAHDSVPSDALLEIRSVASGTLTAQSLKTAIAEYHSTESQLAAKRALLTDEHPDVKILIAKVSDLKKVKIPQYATDLLNTLRTRRLDDSVRIASASVDLRLIPERTIEEGRLVRIRDIAAGLYSNLQGRFAEAQLAEASATPDVSMLDPAVAPLAPTKNTAPGIIAVAIIGGIGAAIGLAILLDILDRRLRYPEQATDELGLAIAGAVPKFPRGGVDQNSPEQVFQLVESFRSLRMNVVNAAVGGNGSENGNGNGHGAVSLAISSPSPHEGKSLIAANLAMSFADAGFRTLLVDGDTRRGALHEMFSMPATPGLTDYLCGAAALPEIIRVTGRDALSVIPCGTRRRRSPEMLMSSRLPHLISELRASYEVVIVDTPPLAAGVDGYSISTATGNLLVVLRVGKTARRMAAEKLRMFDRLPVNIIGAVLNGIKLTDGYEYYGYVPGYDATEDATTMEESNAVVAVEVK